MKVDVVKGKYMVRDGKHGIYIVVAARPKQLVHQKWYGMRSFLTHQKRGPKTSFTTRVVMEVCCNPLKRLLKKGYSCQVMGVHFGNFGPFSKGFLKK